MKNLQIQQLDKKMQAAAALRKISHPQIGWIKTVRITLGISLRQLASKLLIAKQSLQEIEQREVEGSISLKTLKEVANALDMDFVYGFFPRDGSLDKLIDRKARILAKEIVMRTSVTMALENQKNTDKRIQKAIEERIEHIKRESPKIIWD